MEGLVGTHHTLYAFNGYVRRVLTCPSISLTFLPRRQYPGVHPQLLLHPTSTDEIWLLLTRHFSHVGVGRTYQSDLSKEFISLQTFEEGDARSGASGKGGAYTDSPHVLVSPQLHSD